MYIRFEVGGVSRIDCFDEVFRAEPKLIGNCDENRCAETSLPLPDV